MGLGARGWNEEGEETTWGLGRGWVERRWFSNEICNQGLCRTGNQRSGVVNDDERKKDVRRTRPFRHQRNDKSTHKNTRTHCGWIYFFVLKNASVMYELDVFIVRFIFRKSCARPLGLGLLFRERCFGMRFDKKIRRMYPINPEPNIKSSGNRKT